MEFKNPLLVVRELARSEKFYRELLNVEIVQDFGDNVILTGGICLQTAESWAGFLNRSAAEIEYGGCDGELYFETEDFDGFLKILGDKKIPLVHPLTEHRWGQRVIRFYDPDHHVIEVGEPIAAVCRRFYQSGLSAEGVARRMDVPVTFVEKCLRSE